MCECVDRIRFICVCVNVWITLIWLMWIGCNLNLACCTCFITCPFFCWSDVPDWSDAPGAILFAVIGVCAFLAILTCSLPMQSDMCARNVRHRIDGGEGSRVMRAASREMIFIELDITDGLSVRCLSAELRGDRAIGLAVVRKNWRACQYLTVALRADKEFGLAAVTANGSAVEFLSVELRGDMEIGLAAVRANGSACQYLTVGLRADKEFGLAAVTVHGSVVQFLSAALRGDREIGLAAARRTSSAIRYLAVALRADRGFGLAVVTENGWAVEFLPAELRGDREIGLAALRNSVEKSFSFGGVEVRQGRWFPWRATWICAGQYLTLALRADKEFGLAAVASTGCAVQYLSEDLKGDMEIGLAAVRNMGSACGYLSVELRADREIGLTAVKGHGMALKYLSADLQADREIGLAAVANDKYSTAYVSQTLREDLLHLAAYWASDVEIVACAELNPCLIQLHLCLNPERGCAEVLCLDVAGSEVARCLFSDFEYMHGLCVFVSSELSVPPMRLKILLPRGSLYQIGTKWDKLDEILDIPKIKFENGNGDQENGMVDFTWKNGLQCLEKNFSRHQSSGSDIHEISSNDSGEIHEEERQHSGSGLAINEEQTSSFKSGDRGESSSSESGEIHECEL